jgi:putative transposase
MTPAADPKLNRAFYLPRLPIEFYQGDAVVHWSMSIDGRKSGWLDERFHSAFREIMLHACARERLLCPVYCLMPDHIHLLWMGCCRDSNQRQGMKFLREHLAPALRPFRFQHQAHDHVLREEQRRRNTFAKVCFYVLENPVRASLCSSVAEWPFCGAVVLGYPTLHPVRERFWETFWRIYTEVKEADAGDIVRPAF